MAADRGDQEGRRRKKSDSQGYLPPSDDEEEEPDFSDPEDFEDDLSTDGKITQNFG